VYWIKKNRCKVHVLCERTLNLRKICVKNRTQRYNRR
jgi:hypothetical protein